MFTLADGGPTTSGDAPQGKDVRGGRRALRDSGEAQEIVVESATPASCQIDACTSFSFGSGMGEGFVLRCREKYSLPTK